MLCFLSTVMLMLELGSAGFRVPFCDYSRDFYPETSLFVSTLMR